MWRIWWPKVDFGYFSLVCHLNFLRQGLSMNLDFTVSAKLTGQQVPGFCPFLPHSTGIIGKCHHIQVLYGFWDMNLSSHSWATSTLPSEPSPQPQAFLLECSPQPMTSHFILYHKLYPQNAPSDFLLTFWDLTTLFSPYIPCSTYYEVLVVSNRDPTVLCSYVSVNCPLPEMSFSID